MNIPLISRSPGFGLSLVAESTTGALIAAELMADAGVTAEDVGANAAKLLYRQVAIGGCVDATSQWLALALMTLCDGVSKVRIHALSDFR
jgi:RNA 3'-terminal phosphate cyclase-like protein